jgi:O-antigen/teichoic acid export membrane protein
MTTRRDPTPDERTAEFWTRRAWWRMAGKTSLTLYASTVLSFVVTVVVARGLGVQDYGVVVLAVAVATFVSTFLDLALEEGVIYHGVRALAAGDVGGLRSLLRASLRFDAAVGVLIAALIVGFAAPIADVASDGRLNPDFIRIAALVTLAGTVDGTTGAVLLLVGRADLRAWTAVASQLTRLVSVLLVLWLGGGPGAVLAAYAAGAAAGAVLQLLLAWTFGWRDWTKAEPSRRARDWLRPLATFGVHTSLTTTLLGSERSLVPIILGALVGPAAAGVFNIALLPVTLVAIASAPIRLLVLPEQAKLAAANQIAVLRRTVHGNLVLGLVLGVPLALLGWFLMPWLIPTLFSDRFEAAVEPARILLIAAVAHLSASVWAKGLPAAIGKPQLRSAMSALFVVSVVGLTAALAPSYGVKGAAIGHTVGAVAPYMVWLFFTERALRREESSISTGGPGGDPSLSSSPIGP